MQGCNAFFRITPDETNALCAFAINRGNIEQRIDVHANNPKFRAAFAKSRGLSIVPLNQCIEKIFSGITPKSGGDAYTGENDGVLFVKSGCLSADGMVTFDETSKIKCDVHNGLMKSSKLKRGDVLIAIVGATIGKVGLYNSDREANINQAIAAIRPKDCLLPEFLVAYMLSPIGQTYLEYLKRPVARANINLQEIGEIGVPLFSIEKQYRLLEIFDIALQERKQKLKQADNLLSSMSSYILSALNIKLGDNKNKLCVAVKLGTIKNDLTFSAQYYNPERLSAIKSLKGNHSIVVKKLCEIVDFRRDIVESCESSEKYLGLAGVESYTGELSGIEEAVSGQAFAYKNGDILYGRLRPYLNKVLLAENDGICSTEFHVMQVLNKTEILPEYLAAIMRSDLILSQTKYMMTGNTHPRISNDDVKNLFIPIPHYELQCKIVAELRNRRNTARLLKQTAEQEWQAAKAQFEKELIGV